MSVHPQARDIVKKIKYEWDMLQYCYRRISHDQANADIHEQNLFLEAFLLHARVLKDFFIRDPRQDDVAAIHFFDDTAGWQKIKNTLCPYLRQHQRRLNKYLAHLTYDRLREDKVWEWGVIFNEIEYAWQQFFSLLPQERKEWFS